MVAGERPVNDRGRLVVRTSAGGGAAGERDGSRPADGPTGPGAPGRSAARLPGVRASGGRLSGDRGQGTLEYVGVAVLMGLVLAVVGGSALGLDTKMVQAVNTVICKITNGSCAGGTTTDLEA